MTEWFKDYSLAVKAMEQLSMLYRCSEYKNCKHSNCPHSVPHRPYPVSSKNGYPQCTDKGTYCHYKEQLVNCIKDISRKEVA